MRSIIKCLALLAVTAILIMLLAQPTVIAQESSDSSTSPNLSPIIEEAKKSGMTVVIMSPDGEDEAAKQAREEESIAEDAYRLRARIRILIANIPSLGNQIVTTLTEASPDGTLNWLWQAILTAGRRYSNRYRNLDFFSNELPASDWGICSTPIPRPAWQKLAICFSVR